MKTALLLALVMAAPATANGWWGVRGRCPREDFSAEVRRARDEAQLGCNQMISLVEYQRGHANRLSAAAAPPLVGPARTGASVPLPPGLVAEPGIDDETVPTHRPSEGTNDSVKDIDAEPTPKPLKDGDEKP